MVMIPATAGATAAAGKDQVSEVFRLVRLRRVLMASVVLVAAQEEAARFLSWVTRR